MQATQREHIAAVMKLAGAGMVAPQTHEAGRHEPHP
jgi:hypothetical protein